MTQTLIIILLSIIAVSSFLYARMAIWSSAEFFRKLTKNTKRKLAIISVCFLAMTSFLYAKNYARSAKELEEEKYFYQKLTEFKESEKDSIDLKELTNFEWEDVCYMWPYGGVDDERFKGVKLNKEIPEDDNDGKFAVIFINKGNGRVFRISRSDFNVQKECSGIENAELKRCAESSLFEQGRCSELKQSKKNPINNNH